MKKSINNLLSRSEIKFWLAIIAMVVSVMVANGRIVTEIALMKQELATISENTKDINKDVEGNTLAITVIETIMEIK